MRVDGCIRTAIRLVALLSGLQELGHDEVTKLLS